MTILPARDARPSGYPPNSQAALRRMIEFANESASPQSLDGWCRLSHPLSPRADAGVLPAIVPRRDMSSLADSDIHALGKTTAEAYSPVAGQSIHMGRGTEQVEAW